MSVMRSGFPTDQLNSMQNVRQGRSSSLKNCSLKRGGHAPSSYIDDQLGILINNIVTVGRTHSDDFNSISEAIELSPRDSGAEDGYHVIYVREGVYEEYVSIPSDRKHILLLGDGIGKTIITGDRNYHDGWGTYYTATFGEKTMCSIYIYVYILQNQLLNISD